MPLEAARALMPWWVGWGILLLIPVVFLLSFACAALSAAIAWVHFPRRKPASWVERARLAYPLRLIAGFNVLAFAAFGLIAALIWCGPLPYVPVSVVALASMAAGWGGAMIVGSWALRRAGIQGAGKGKRLRSLASVSLVLLPHFWLLLVLAALLPPEMNVRAAVLLAVGALLLGFVQWGGGLLIASWVGLARPASSRVKGIVDRAASLVGAWPRETFELTWPNANAFAFPLCQRLAFTEKLLAVLDDEELSAVCSHELGHLTESRATALTRTLGGWLLFPLAAARPIVGSFGWPALGVSYVLFLVGSVLLRRLIRRLEVRADQIALRHQSDAGVYGRALEKLYEINLTPAVMAGKRQTHPHLYDRLLQAGIQPAYPRPQPPSRARIVAAMVVVLGLVTGVVPLAANLAEGLEDSGHHSESAMWTAVALTGGRARQLEELAQRRAYDGDINGAAVLLAAACDMDRQSVYLPANLAMLLCQAGRCEEAKVALAEASKRAQQFAADTRFYEVVLYRAEREVLDCAEKTGVRQRN